MLLIAILGLLFTTGLTSVFYLLRGGHWQGHIIYSVLIYMGFLVSGYFQVYQDKTLLGIEPLFWYCGLILLGTLINVLTSDKIEE